MILLLSEHQLSDCQHYQQRQHTHLVLPYRVASCIEQASRAGLQILQKCIYHCSLLLHFCFAVCLCKKQKITLLLFEFIVVHLAGSRKRYLFVKLPHLIISTTKQCIIQAQKQASVNTALSCMFEPNYAPNFNTLIKYVSSRNQPYVLFDSKLPKVSTLCVKGFFIVSCHGK